MEVLDASFNLISDLSDIEDCYNLKRLNLCHNKLASPETIMSLSFLVELTELDISSNPIQSLPNYDELLKNYIFRKNENLKLEFTYTDKDEKDKNVSELKIITNNSKYKQYFLHIFNLFNLFNLFNIFISLSKYV